jgi:hypothetical protein
VAMDQGRVAALNIAGKPTPYVDAAPQRRVLTFSQRPALELRLAASPVRPSSKDVGPDEWPVNEGQVVGRLCVDWRHSPTLVTVTPGAL